MSISLNEPKVAWKTSAKKVVVGATRRRKVVFSTAHESQEKRSSGTRSGTVAILVIRQERPRTSRACMFNIKPTVLFAWVFESMRRLSWAWPHKAYMFIRHLKP
jgi:hypothetical protein